MARKQNKHHLYLLKFKERLHFVKQLKTRDRKYEEMMFFSGYGLHLTATLTIFPF